MRRNKVLLAGSSMLMVMALSFAALGCSPAQSGDSSGGGDSGSYAEGSLMAVHENGEMGDGSDTSNKFCLSCHPREAINAANEGYGGNPDFNPHQGHLAAGDCITCHSVGGVSTLTCNECHDAPLPDGWQSAERGAGPIHKLFSE